MGWTGVADALADALVELDRAEASNWKLPGGDPADQELATLRDLIEHDLAQVRSGTPPSSVSLIALLRFVLDWIPDPNDPLRHAVGRAGLAAQAAEKEGQGKPAGP